LPQIVIGNTTENTKPLSSRHKSRQVQSSGQRVGTTVDDVRNTSVSSWRLLRTIRANDDIRCIVTIDITSERYGMTQEITGASSQNLSPYGA
jgi:GDP-D-mannose dehydratase